MNRSLLHAGVGGRSRSIALVDVFIGTFLQGLKMLFVPIIIIDLFLSTVRYATSLRLKIFNLDDRRCISILSLSVYVCFSVFALRY